MIHSYSINHQHHQHHHHPNSSSSSSSSRPTYDLNPHLNLQYDQSQFAPPPPPQSQPAEEPCSVIKTYRAYFTLTEVDRMIRIQSAKLAPARVEATRQQACIFMDKVGTRLGFPRRTIASAQLLYHRFHLFFPFSSFNPHEVSISSLMLASKMEDTLKKLRDIQMIAWLVRNIQEGGTGQGEPEMSLIESERGKLVGIERLLLETVCFDFGSGKCGGSKDAFGYVIAIGRHLRSPQSLLHLAFRLTVDSYRTLVGLTYPPHIIALACLYLASFFDPDHHHYSFGPFTSKSEKIEPYFETGWSEAFDADIDDLEDICHSILDLFISLASPLKSNQSPTSPSEVKPRRVTDLNTSTSTLNGPFPSSDQLTKLKISLRERAKERHELELKSMEDEARSKRIKLMAGLNDEDERLNEVRFEGSELLGRDDVTVRFVFGHHR
ncbi:cyclin-like protein [Melampsora americana]|nr:cyclin-like protein [Melampsora americana]